MHDRSALGPADVDDATLTAMVADLLGASPEDVRLLTSSADPVSYDLPALTTLGRTWVRGTATVSGATEDFTFFVKHVQCWTRSEIFAQLPPPLQATAAKNVPWRTEPLAYRSRMHENLPDGLLMPRALGVFDLDELSSAVWMEEIPAVDVTWDLARYEHAAHLLGRFAGSPAMAPFGRVGAFDWTVSAYTDGRLTHQVVPALFDDNVWRHPLVAEAFGDELRDRLRASGARLRAYTDELETMPTGASHGDACPNNLLVRADRPGFTMIDFGFLHVQPLGFDLGQLLVGDVQIGRRGSEDLVDRAEACLNAYHAGLAAEGVEIPLTQLRRAHALHLMLFTGLSTVPLEHLGGPLTTEKQTLAAERAALARFSLDLLDATG